MSLSLPIYAVSDLHLSHDGRKPMDQFGPVWENHPEALFVAWDRDVPADALVLIPGDLSWGMRPGDIAADYKLIDARPGSVKLLSPGNHDLAVWSSQNKARSFCAPLLTLLALKSSAQRFALPGDPGRGVVVAAARGSLCPEDPWWPTDPAVAAAAHKTFQKELGRLHAALAAAAALREPGDALIVQIHYPPLSGLTESSAFTAAIEQAGADVCVFGHLHGSELHAEVFQGRRNGVLYRLVGCDALNMVPLRVGELTPDGFVLDAGAETVGMNLAVPAGESAG